MALTRAQVERILVRRVGALLTSAGLDTSNEGANEDLNDGIGYAARQLGATVANISLVADSDLSAIGAADYDQLLDLAELRTLETIVQNLDDVNIKVGPLATNYSEFADRAQKALEKKRAALKDAYGFGSAQLEAGMITLDLARKESDLVS